MNPEPGTLPGGTPCPYASSSSSEPVISQKSQSTTHTRMRDTYGTETIYLPLVQGSNQEHPAACATPDPTDRSVCRVLHSPHPEVQYRGFRLSVQGFSSISTGGSRIRSRKPGEAGGTRTPDQQLRRLLLYPSELQPRALIWGDVPHSAHTLFPTIAHLPALSQPPNIPPVRAYTQPPIRQETEKKRGMAPAPPTPLPLRASVSP